MTIFSYVNVGCESYKKRTSRLVKSVGDEKRKEKEVNLRFTPVVKFKVK